MRAGALPLLVTQLAPYAHGALFVTNHQVNCGAQLFGSTNVPVGGTGSDDVSNNAKGAVKIRTVNDQPCKQTKLVYFTKTKCSSTETGMATKTFNLVNGEVCVNLPSDGSTKCVNISCSKY